MIKKESPIIMEEKFKNRYRIASVRKPNWDYSWDGIYYVTICTGGRELYYGDVVNGQMIFSDIGQEANNFWKEIPEHFRFVRLDEFQIMPNHVHGLIEINREETANLPVSINPENIIEQKRPVPVSENEHKQITEPDENRYRTVAASEKWKPGTLGTIINQYKRAVTIIVYK